MILQVSKYLKEMLKARGSQQQMILFPIERGRNTLFGGLPKLQI
jgi:hypothetical protein